MWVILALPLLAALGLAVVVLAAPRRVVLHHERTRLLALACASGLLVNYALGIALPQLTWVLVAECAISVAAVTWAFIAHRPLLLDMLAIGWTRWLMVAAGLLLFSGPILFHPLQDWDARSVWFFSAKRIFFGGGLGAGPGDWTLADYDFSHADYPKLLPLLAAQFAQAWSLWNEYVPKASLLALLAPVLLGLLGLPRRIGLSLVFLAGVLLLSTKQFVWNGYADTYLCLYAVLSMAYLARFLSSTAPVDLALGSAFMGVAVNLKNEGALLAISIAFCLFAWHACSRQARGALQWRRWPAGAWIALALPWIGFAGWSLTKHQWQLANDLQLGSGSVLRAWQRVTEGQLGPVAKALFLRTDAGKSVGLLLTSAALAWALRCRVPATAWFPASVALLYSAGMFVIYLATPNDVTWHLATSAERTMLLAAFGFLGSTFLVLESLESRDPAPSGSVEHTGLQT
jgi:hypothetical protein